MSSYWLETSSKIKMAEVCLCWECDSAVKKEAFWDQSNQIKLVITLLYFLLEHNVMVLYKMASLQKIYAFVFQVNLSIAKQSTL